MAEHDGIKDFLNRMAEKREERPLSTPTVRGAKTKIIIVFLVVLAMSTVVVFVKKSVVHYVAIKQTETSSLIERVGELTELPEGEIPVVATVTNADLLKDQTFFKEAKIGDKVLVFNLSKKVILYRPSVGKIISIAPLN